MTGYEIEKEHAVKIIKAMRTNWDEDSKTPNAHALDMAIKALDKQIPKDVIFVHPLQKDDDGDYMCPSCETGTVYNAYGKKSLYCPYCGQALK